eukprot:2870970-Amphidinium_carterae.1
MLAGTIPQGLGAQPRNTGRIFMSAGARTQSPRHPFHCSPHCPCQDKHPNLIKCASSHER